MPCLCGQLILSFENVRCATCGESATLLPLAADPSSEDFFNYISSQYRQMIVDVLDEKCAEMLDLMVESGFMPHNIMLNIFQFVKQSSGKQPLSDVLVNIHMYLLYRYIAKLQED